MSILAIVFSHEHMLSQDCRGLNGHYSRDRSESSEDFLGRVRVKFAQNEVHEKAINKKNEEATKKPPNTVSQADEGHGKATKK